MHSADESILWIDVSVFKVKIVNLNCLIWCLHEYMYLEIIFLDWLKITWFKNFKAFKNSDFLLI